MAINDHSYLIIGGTTKAGTTSLFNYLSEHPDICAASYKETRFFLDQDYPLQSKYRLNNDGLDKYNEFFFQCKGVKLRMEATPDYLYSTGCANRVASSLPGAKMVFILRDPVDRLKSWYKFAQQKGFISEKFSFDDYVLMQLQSLQSSNTPQYMRALEQGRHSSSIDEYKNTFGDERCLVIPFHELANEPVSVMRKICHFSDIDPGMYDDYQFRIENMTVGTRFSQIQRVYAYIIFNLRIQTHSKPRLHRFFKKARVFIDSYYKALNQKKKSKIEISPDILGKLRCYYNEYYFPDQNSNS